MPAPTPEQIDEIVARLQEAIDRGMPEPTAYLSAEQHGVLVDLYFHNGRLTGNVTEQHLREYARQFYIRDNVAGAHWRSLANRRAIDFSIYETAAEERRVQRAADIQAADNVHEMNGTGRARRRRNTTLNVETPADMVETQATKLVALGLLEQQRAGRCWYDSFFKRAFTDWNGTADGELIDTVPIDDAFIRRAQTWLMTIDSRMARLTEANVHNIIMSFAESDERNAPRDWLIEQSWDGIPRLMTLFTRGFGAPDTRFNAEAGRCWIISMVARIMSPGAKVDTMPVLIGGQGLFKSQALRRIGGDWYRAASSGIDSRDFLQELHGALVFEIPELHSIISSRHGAARVKAVLSIEEDHFRLSYGRIAQTFKRTAVMVGTTNNRDWHTDDTGGRRFWPIHVGAIDLDWLSEYRGQLFAEAHQYWRSRKVELELRAEGGGRGDESTDDDIRMGEWWNVPADEQAALIDAETFVHPWQETIAARLEASQSALYRGLTLDRPTPWDGTTSESTDWGNVLTTTRIAHQWLGLHSAELGRGMSTGKTIGSVMRALGWEMKKVRMPGSAGTVNAWVPVPSERARLNLGMLGGSNGTDGTGGPEDEPDESPF